MNDPNLNEYEDFPERTVPEEDVYDKLTISVAGTLPFLLKEMKFHSFWMKIKIQPNRKLFRLHL